MKLHEQVKVQAAELQALRAGISRLRQYLTGAKFHNDTNVNVRDVLLRLDETLRDANDAKDSIDIEGYYTVQYLRKGYGSSLCSVTVYASGPEVARAQVIGSGVAIPGTVNNVSKATYIDSDLARAHGGIYPQGALES